MSEMCVEGGISCTLAVVVLSTPYLVLCATTPFRLKVYAKYLAFTHLDRKTELLSMFTFGVCVANAACSFAFMAVGGFTDVLLTLYALSMTSAWLCAIVQMNQQLWRVPEWPEYGLRVFGMVAIVTNMITLIVIPTPGAFIAIPVVMLVLSCSFVATAYLKEVFYTPLELDQLAMDRVCVDIYDGNPLVVSSDMANSPLIHSPAGHSFSATSLPWWRRVFQWSGGNDNEEKSRISHKWFRVAGDDDMEGGEGSLVGSRHSMDSNSSRLSQQSQGTEQQHHIVKSALEKHSFPLHSAGGKVSKRSKSDEASSNSIGSSGSGSKENGDGNTHNTAASEPSKAVIRALENQRRFQRSPNLPSSPPLKQPTPGVSLSAGERARAKSCGEGEYSVKVERWAVRKAEDADDGRYSMVSDIDTSMSMSLHTDNDDEGGGSPDDSLNTSGNAETDRESGVDESESRRNQLLSNSSSNDDQEVTVDIEFAIEVTRHGADAMGSHSTGWDAKGGDSSPGSTPVEVGRQHSDDSTGTAGSLTGGRGNRSPSQSKETWTVWRTGAELLQLHAGLVAVKEAVPRKPRLKTVLHSSAVGGATRKHCDQDKKTVAIFLSTLLRRKSKEGGQAPATIPPALLCFLEIKESDRVSLAAR